MEKFNSSGDYPSNSENKKIVKDFENAKKAFDNFDQGGGVLINDQENGVPYTKLSLKNNPEYRKIVIEDIKNAISAVYYSDGNNDSYSPDEKLEKEIYERLGFDLFGFNSEAVRQAMINDREMFERYKIHPDHKYLIRKSGDTFASAIEKYIKMEGESSVEAFDEYYPEDAPESQFVNLVRTYANNKRQTEEMIFSHPHLDLTGSNN